MKVCEQYKLETIILKQHEDRNDFYFVVHVLWKTTKLSFSRSVSKDNDGSKCGQLIAFPHEVIV